MFNKKDEFTVDITGSKKKSIFVAIAIVLCLVVIVALFLKFSKDKDSDVVSSISENTVSENITEEVVEEVVEEVPEQTIEELNKDKEKGDKFQSTLTEPVEAGIEVTKVISETAATESEKLYFNEDFSLTDVELFCKYLSEGANFVPEDDARLVNARTKVDLLVDAYYSLATEHGANIMILNSIQSDIENNTETTKDSWDYIINGENNYFSTFGYEIAYSMLLNDIINNGKSKVGINFEEEYLNFTLDVYNDFAGGVEIVNYLTLNDAAYFCPSISGKAYYSNYVLNCDDLSYSGKECSYIVPFVISSDSETTKEVFYAIFDSEDNLMNITLYNMEEEKTDWIKLLQ